ncbi:hypothetical protein PJWF_00015 [Achromobacter phage JWF]|uniref:hypothetical protein n=1 Tax=Achromobacter phage JWF TaxID=1589748 RepID=UPI000588E854|nr:hypothetical protein AXJ13_gp015 [Achromobacter phage JWF]AJD82909.1 hypothetical protein PJWF_00015 [Achromobacter phage JWF]
MSTPAQAIASLRAQINNVVLEQVNRRVAMTADRLSTRLKSRVKTDLQTFFLQFRTLLNGLQFDPDWVYDYNNTPWRELNFDYVKTKKADRIDYFVYSELPKVLRRAARNRRKTIGGSEGGRASLRKVLAGIANPERIFGPVTVTVQSNTGINKSGKRYYLAGTTLDGVKAGGRLVQNGRDVVSIMVNWAPKFDGKNVLQRGVVEAALPRAGRLRQKLMNRDGSYRALIGPRMLWYQDQRIPEIIQQIIDGKGLK